MTTDIRWTDIREKFRLTTVHVFEPTSKRKGLFDSKETWLTVYNVSMQIIVTKKQEEKWR